MPTEQQVIFTVQNMSTLMDLQPDKIVVRIVPVEGTDPDVFADAYRRGESEPLGTVSGCPMPPCSIDD